MLVAVPNNISADTANASREINLLLYFSCEYRQNCYSASF
jgi:hypothetical protein